MHLYLQEGDSGDALFVLVTGKAHVTQKVEGEPDGQKTLREMGAGDYFGWRRYVGRYVGRYAGRYVGRYVGPLPRLVTCGTLCRGALVALLL